MVREVHLWLNYLPTGSQEKTILHAVASLRLRGRTCKAGYREMQGWLRASSATVGRALVALETKGYIRRKRRGKKLTNLIFLGKKLWQALTDGRKVPRFKGVEHDENTSGDSATTELARLWRKFGLTTVPPPPTFTHAA